MLARYSHAVSAQYAPCRNGVAPAFALQISFACRLEGIDVKKVHDRPKSRARSLDTIAWHSPSRFEISPVDAEHPVEPHASVSGAAGSHQLDQTFQHAREFALYAPHELKTRLMLMRTDLERLRDATPRSTTRRDCVATLLEETQRLAGIVDTLTLLTKADVGLVNIERNLVLLPEIVCECFQETQILAEPHRITVSLRECDPAIVTGDWQRLRQLLLTLADNAVKYNVPGGAVTFSLRSHDGHAELSVSNTGIGVPPELQARVFERFVRGERARELAPDGCGLGLSLCQWIAKAHGGAITLSSTPAGLTVVTVRLPAHT